MSHRKERAEKVCLNCNTQLVGRYCHLCGQENTDPKESTWHLITHFVSDVFHFDGKFFLSLKYLMLKPGFLSAEYLKGRRASYLNPVKMYIFTSFVFFFITFFYTSHEMSKFHDKTSNIAINQTLVREKESLMLQLKQPHDSVQDRRIRRELKDINEDIAFRRLNGHMADYETLDTTGLAMAEKEWTVDTTNFTNDSNYPSIAAYDSVQRKLPPEKQDDWLAAYVARKGINLKHAFRTPNFKQQVVENFSHSIPTMMLVSLPLVAFFLYLLYIRRYKSFPYVSHGIFTLHIYVAIYIFVLIAYLFLWLGQLSTWSLFKWLFGLVGLCMLFYQYKAMRRFYGQRRAKTIFKFILLNCFVFILLSILNVIFVINAVASIQT